MTLRSQQDLRSVYKEASGGPIDKVIDKLDQHCIDFLARCPFFVLSTAGADGTCDGSPKGGKPGFVQALDSQRVAWADLSGNNRLDSFENLVENTHAALLLMIPGFDETLRINGQVELHTDAELCERFAVGDKPAKVVAVLTVAEAYIHCSKAFRRSELWSADAWPDLTDLPSGPAMVRDHANIPVEPEVLEELLEQDAADTLWKPGGES